MIYELHITSGPDTGRVQRIEAGEIIMGRGDHVHLRVASEAVSWEHAVIREEDGKLRLHNLSASGTSVNGARIAAPRVLRANDEIELAPDCRVRLLPADGEQPRAAGGLLVPLAIAALLIVGAVVVLAQRGGRTVETETECSGTTADWVRAYGLLDGWLGAQIDAGRITPMTRRLLQDGWRFERLANHASSATAFSQLRTMLANQSLDRGMPVTRELARQPEYETALCDVFNGATPASDTHALAALWHFAERSLDWNLKQAEGDE